ncbi:hypothetical protein LTR17_008379 [Elasticomyces elasticus]|nr:hypothetical protein LTR17_008379 [Elasticomyces elasticus]
MNKTETGGVPTSSILIVIWAISSALWCMFTTPEHTFAARVLLYQPAWLLRAMLGEHTWLQDLTLLLGLHTAYGYIAGHWQLLQWTDLRWLDPQDATIRLYLQIFALLAMCSLFAGGIVFRGRRLHEKETDGPLHEQRIEEQVLPPLLLTSRTTHSRMFPKKHAFSYSYLLVGIPVGWFHVDSADFLERGNEGATLAEKLNAYLHTQGVTDRDYAFAYLVTAPRFLGYSFNPVSFWYLYDSDTRLKYMILEVNNTFDERRLYLLKGGGPADVGADNEPRGGSKATKQLVFTDTWAKDFHVSPFNSRKGSYSLRATDPLAEYEQSGRVRIDNTIVLRSSKEHPKIVARVFSEGIAKDPATVSSLEAASFIARWCWVGFATFPRIVWQAAKLSLQRKLHLWYRPEVTEASISRPYTSDETILEPFIRRFLAYIVQEASEPIRLVYEPAHSEGSEIVFYSPSFTYEEDQKRTVTLKVLSPAFYSRFIHYSEWYKAIDTECFTRDERNRPATLEGTTPLPGSSPDSTLNNKAGLDEKQHVKTRSSGLVDQVRWACMRRLRCPPATYAYPDNAVYALSMSYPAPSALDVFVQEYCDDEDTYRRTAIKLFLAQRLCFGIPALLNVLDYLLRSVLLLVGLVYSDRTHHPVDLFRPREIDLSDAGTLLCMMLLANSVHIWSLLTA